MKPDNASGADIDRQGEPRPLDWRAGETVDYDHIDQRVIYLD